MSWGVEAGILSYECEKLLSVFQGECGIERDSYELERRKMEREGMQLMFNVDFYDCILYQ